MWQKRFHRLLVSDQVVIDKVEMSAPAQLVQPVELGEHLFRHLGARNPAVKLDDVAELTHERAAARELHGRIDVVPFLQQVEARDRGLGDVNLKSRALEK